MSSRPFVLSILISLLSASTSLAADTPAEGAASTPAATPTAQASTPTAQASTPTAQASTPTAQASTPAAAPSSPSSPAAAPAEEGPPLIDLLQTNDYKSTWALIFKGEYSPSRWIETLDATSSPLSEVKANGKTYLVGSLANVSNPKGNKFIVAFTNDKKKGWGVELTVPAGIGRDAVLHPKKYATIRYFNNPDNNMKKVLMDYLGSKEPNWK